MSVLRHVSCIDVAHLLSKALQVLGHESCFDKYLYAGNYVFVHKLHEGVVHLQGWTIGILQQWRAWPALVDLWSLRWQSCM